MANASSFCGSQSRKPGRGRFPPLPYKGGHGFIVPARASGIPAKDGGAPALVHSTGAIQGACLPPGVSAKPPSVPPSRGRGGYPVGDHRRPAAHPCLRILRICRESSKTQNVTEQNALRHEAETNANPGLRIGRCPARRMRNHPAISPGFGFHVMSSAKRSRGNVRFARNLAAASRLEPGRRPRASAFRAVCPATNADNEFCENSQALPGWCQEEKNDSRCGTSCRPSLNRPKAFLIVSAETIQRFDRERKAIPCQRRL